MAVSNVELIVNAVKAINPLRAVAATSKKAEKAIDSLKKSAKATGDTLADIGRKGKKGLSELIARARSAAGSFGKLGKAAALAAAAAGAAAFLKFSFGQAGELERQTKSLQVLTGSLETAKGIISELQAFGAVTPFTSTELIETAKRMKAFGFETNQVVGITKRLADVAGATGADLGGIATAFGQIQAKGRLQGEELLQLQERGVALQDELRKMYGLTGEEFSKALQKGQISAKAAEIALIRLTEKGGKYANGAIAQSDTLFGKLSTLQDALQRFGQNIGKVLSPIFKGIIQFLTTITNQINNLFREASIANKVRKEFGLDTVVGRQKMKRMSVADRRQMFASMEARRQELRDSDYGQKQPTVTDIKIPELTQGTTGTVRSGSGKTPEERAADALKQQREQAAALLLSKKQEVLLTGDITEKQRDQLQHVINKMNLSRQFPSLKEEELQVLRDQLDVNFGLTQADKDRIQAAKDLKEQQNAEAKRAEKLAQQYQGIADTLADGVVNALKGAVDGTQSLAEAANNMLNDLANQLLQVARNMLFFGSMTGSLTKGSGLLGSIFGGFMANGGTTKAGKSYVVGERGPELFTPGVTGTVTPNSALGGSNIVVNVDASGSNVQGDAQQGKALGQAIGAAVQAELIKQKRPGGLLS